MKFAIAVLIVFVVAVLSLVLWLVPGRRADGAEWARLAGFQPDTPATFAPEMVVDLPEPARRYFGYTIRPATPHWPVVEIDFRGRFSLGTKVAPNNLPLDARQILAAPEGFVWAMHTRGGMPLSGSDPGHWTRFRIFGVIPVARAGGTPDHTRSTLGCYVGEVEICSPAALLPGPDVALSAVDEDTARVTVTHGDLEHAVDTTTDPVGRPVEGSFQRWSNADPDKVHRRQSLGADMSDFREVGGDRLPFRVEVGNLFGTEDYFPFFVAEVTDMHLPGALP